MKKIILLVIGLCILGIENTSAQKDQWAKEKYVTFLTCLNAMDDYECAKTELIRLSAQGDPQAKCCLAAMLCYGERNDRDYQKALELLKESANENYERAEYLLGSFGSLEKSREFMRAITGDDSNTDATDDGFWKQCFKATRGDVESFKDAFMWFLLEDGYWGYKDIMYFSGVQYLNGAHGLKDATKAIKWLKKSKENGSAEASRLLDTIMRVINSQNGE